jgi:dTDP-4-amino-4,6-dideoxygalactose transaminase
LRHCGRVPGRPWYEHHRLGWNVRMSEFAAALARTQLRKLPEQNARRMANVKHFFDRIREVDGLTPVRLHPEGLRRNHYIVMLRYDAEKWDGLPREQFLRALSAEGVPATGGYLHLNFENPLFKNLDFASPGAIYRLGRNTPYDPASFQERCPHAARACREEAVWITHIPFLGDTQDVDAMADAILKVKKQTPDLLNLEVT